MYSLLTVSLQVCCVYNVLLVDRVTTGAVYIMYSLLTVAVSLQVRKVEYKDKMEEEWERFQKSMKEEAHVSSAWSVSLDSVG